jgi:hypothetical protein
VVDTTLAGMERQAQRKQLEREAQGAALGGTSNTRTSVGNAVAEQLNNYNMAEIEAKIRNDAHKFAAEQGMTEAEYIRKVADDMFGRGSEMAKALTGEAAAERTMADTMFGWGKDVSKGILDEAAAERTLSQDIYTKGKGYADFMSGEADSTYDRGADYAKYMSGEADTQYDLGSTLFDQGESAAKLYGDTGSTMFGRGAVIAGTTGALGEQQRMLDQQAYDEERTAAQQANAYLGDVYAGTAIDKGPYDSKSTTKVPDPKGPSLMQSIVGGGFTLAGGMMKSDERSKEDIEPVTGNLDKLAAADPKTYRYKPGEGHRTDRHTGLIAQDLESIPGAVVEDERGSKMVDPYSVLATVVGAVNELRREITPGAGLGDA